MNNCVSLILIVLTLFLHSEKQNSAEVPINPEIKKLYESSISVPISIVPVTYSQNMSILFDGIPIKSEEL